MSAPSNNPHNVPVFVFTGYTSLCVRSVFVCAHFCQILPEALLLRSLFPLCVKLVFVNIFAHPVLIFPSCAVELAMIMDRLYGGVCYAGIDTDPELKYPKGAGRVAFSNQQSYIAAISARFVQLQHGEIDKRVSRKKRELSVSRSPLLSSHTVSLKLQNLISPSSYLFSI